jgi:hypothetical protein
VFRVPQNVFRVPQVCIKSTVACYRVCIKSTAIVDENPRTVGAAGDVANHDRSVISND